MMDKDNISKIRNRKIDAALALHGLTPYLNEKTYATFKESLNDIPFLLNVIIEGDGITDKPNVPEVINEQGVSPYCSTCGTSSFLYNPDEEQNDYCGKCGVSLDWSAIDEDRYNDED